MQTLGVNIGSTSLKMVLCEDGKVIWSDSLSHEGDFSEAARKLLSDGNVPVGIPALITGNEGRFIFNLSGTLEPVCVESAIKALGIDADAVVSMGGEDLIVYSLNKGKIVGSFSGNKCASGTGEFLMQQLARMDLGPEDIEKVPETAKVYPISTRCSVFMKSDCTHKLNKREASKQDIVLSLSHVMAVKVIDFLKRANIKSGRVVLTGGMTLNSHVIRFIRESAPNIEFIVPETASVFEALGASVLAAEFGRPLPEFENLMKPGEVKFETLEALEAYVSKVKLFDKPDGKVQTGRRYILGVDGGSTTTKACLVDAETKEVVASHYGRTHGDPVKALKECLKILQDKVYADTGSKDIDIITSATTGSSREILGVFLETRGVYNEIIAHSMGTTYYDSDVETIFEIGGQDAKYVLLKNGVPIDYAMNEACSAGTGSFLEESAAGDLSIFSDRDIGPIALKAKTPLKFGEHCSAFINSDIRKAIGQGATREDITAGIVCSIVANYLNRVVGNRTISGKVFLQGGVAKNPAVSAAFAMLLGKEILVPPSPELMGCFGVALLAERKLNEGLPEESSVDIDRLLETEIEYDKVFACQACENFCPIQVLKLKDRKIMFGGRCNKYANMRKSIADVPIFDYVERRQKLLYEDYAAPSTPSTGDGEAKVKRNYTVGIPKAISVHTLYPLYSWFFYKLGIKTILSTEVPHEGMARAEAAYCFPAEIAHGAVQDCLDKGADYVLLPHFRDMPSYETDVHANFCPLTQSLPYYITKAFPHVDEKKWLPLVVSFKFGNEKALELFSEIGEKLGISDDEIKQAFDFALSKQNEYFKAAKRLGLEALKDAREADRPVIAILGRAYNAFAPEANMGIPRKFTTRGYSIVPFDILPFESETIFPNMYWYYGQEDVKSASLLKNEDNIYLTYVSNFSCAPDSFILHYIKWIMGQKPFLVLELDNHTADAGIDTRVEAFLDVIDGYKSRKADVEGERYDNGWRFVSEKQPDGEFDLRVDNDKTGESVPIRGNKRVKVLLANMGEISTEYIGAVLRGQGLGAEALPVATSKTVMAARAHSSGKECVPSHLVLGSALEFVWSENYRKDELYLLFVPITTGPCRTGQYYVYYENLFKDMRLENVVVFTLSADNSYGELGSGFSKDMWKGIVLSDYLKDIRNSLNTTASDRKSALAAFDKSWRKLMDVVEHRPNDIWKELQSVADDVKKIPLKMKVTDCPKVIVVGEIYVRRDDFAVGELTDLMSERGIIVKAASVGEWIHYLDFVRTYDLDKQLNLLSPFKRFLSVPWRKKKKLGIEKWWKHSVEKKVLSILMPTGLIPETPHDMELIMGYTRDNFVNLELQSEIAVSTGSAAAAMEAGYSGVINIAPFACLIGRVIEGIFTPWARDRNYPVLSVEVDGNVLPPNIVNKLNIFMVNVLRFKGEGDISKLVDDAP
ncbi:MAG: acyl-CoA dehydratase activase [Oscillospiraceae bacterium]|nr:acyl-CoA dehydratase activase [Oscillospiraceae bacterium]MCL2277935.1 acyl-CoA dehydratase activase [Oscillospiraceae bacterium]